ncbi:hypothetical protein FRC00_002305 [Tulasnella sp. 408]|nr:hypothetical protein FRC00_002305 [Tulasnella sp. 408]
MSRIHSPLDSGLTLGNVIADKTYSAVDSGLQAAADSVERLSDAIRTPPPTLSAEDEVDGVYHSAVARLIDNFRAQLKRGLPFDLSLQNVLSIIDALLTSKIAGGIDDRLFLLEHALTFLSRYPPNTVTSKELQDKVIALLWYDLAHPPASVVGSDYQYRKADGSGTSIWHPDMGMAGQPYARSVQTIHPLPANQLPSPELLFDSLLKREDKPAPHPAGLSTFFFAFANLVIHSLFWTTFKENDEDPDTEDFTQPINKVSSYLDLSPLYGSSEQELNSIRLNDGTGRIQPDTFADPRVLNMPPSTPALLVMFSRNHNYIVEKLLDINERGKWKKPHEIEGKRKQRQDDEIFGTARLINCGWFMSTIFGDYLASILGLVREGNSWSLDPLSNFRAASHEIVERGSGNIVSVEFLALYHFHSSIGVGDEKWAEDAMARLVGTRDWDSIDIKTYREAIKRERLNPRNQAPPNTWPIGRYQRVDGRFRDEDLAKILLDATEQPANAFKARGTPHVMRIIEIMGITLNREWGTCSLNEFRKFLNLKPYSTFEEWNPRKDVADAARRLYRHPDNIELYVGLQAEESKTVMPGAGLCPGFTMSRAILADAVALVRGDRFLTNDFTAYNLTAWGMQDCTRDPKNSANGGMMGKLLGRCLPNHFPVDSSYTNFPFVVPKDMKKFLTDVHKADGYTFTRPAANKPVAPVTKYHEVMAALASPGLGSTVPENAKIVLEGGGYLHSYDKADVNAADKKLIAEAFVPTPVVLKKHVDYLERTTAMLLKEKSYTLVGDNKQSVNIVRDVINLLPAYFISEHVLGLPLKTPENPHGSALDQEVYLKFKEIYEFIFIDIAEPSTKVAKESTVKGYSQYFQDTVQAHIQSIASEQIPIIGLGASAIHWATQTPYEANKWLKRLLDAGKGKSKEELANDAVALAIALSVEFSQALTHVVDEFLGKPDPKERTWTPNLGGTSENYPPTTDEIHALASDTTDKEATTRLAKIVVKALRTRPPVPGTYRSVSANVAQLNKSKGDRVYLSFTEAGVDPSVWGNDVKPTIPPPQALFAGEIVKLLGPEWLVNAIVPVIRTIFKLRHIKRAPGNSGKLLSFDEKIEGTPVTTYLNYKQEPTFWSSDLTVTFTA